VTFNGFFAVAFGISLILLAGVILARLYYQRNEFSSNTLRGVLFGFSILTFISGIFSFVLEKDWDKSLSVNGKVPMYFMLGSSLAFALLYSIFDIVRHGLLPLTFLRPGPSAKPLVASSPLLAVILTYSVTMGAVYGLVFGVLDVEDQEKRFSRLTSISLSVGTSVGAVIGLGHVYLQHREQTSESHYGLLSSEG